jgi:hypothetical protein
MKRSQGIALGIAALNVALALSFPPHDYIPLARGAGPAFDGFHWIFSALPNRTVNRDFLLLELLVIAINLSIAWLLLARPAPSRHATGLNPLQHGALWGVALNLLLMLLFPPFEYAGAISRTVMPTFDGFYFVFGENGTRQIVTAMLYIEVVLVLVNGALALLLLQEHGEAEPAVRTLDPRGRRPA